VTVTPVYDKIVVSSKRIVALQGGARSTKTYSICQFFINKFRKTTGEKLTIFRKTLPAVKDTVLEDFESILCDEELYNRKDFNKTTSDYRLNGNLIQFRSVDDPHKKRGAKRNYLWLNEANEFNHEDFKQLAMRTTGRIFLDYNPSDEFHWIYDHVLTRDDCQFIKSTYLDNPFLEKEIVNEIERLKITDENSWMIYGLGEKGSSKAKIYNNYEIIKELPECEFYKIGIDFGFNNPTAVIRVGIKDQDVYLDELLYKRKLTNPQLIEKLEGLVDFNDELLADSAEPARIEDMRIAGYNVNKAYKGKGSVIGGIDALKSKKIYITENSLNIIKEIKNYKFREDLKTGEIYDEPVKFNDHAMDAMRYATYKQMREIVKIW